MAKTWLVYLINECETGSEGWSGWSHYCIAEGDTDSEIYLNWVKNIKKLYGKDLSKYLHCVNGEWSCYYPLAKVELPTSVYGHAKELIIEVQYDKHED